MMTVREIQLKRPNLHAGWQIFASRPLSLVGVLILAVVLSIVSFGLFALPAISAYYDATRRSRRERFFIDLEAIANVAGLFLRGIRKHFLRSYLVGVFGLLVAIGLLVTPVVVFEAQDQKVSLLTLSLQILFLPAFFWAGAVLLHGYPYLVQTNEGLAALRYAWCAGWRHPLLSLLVGFLILFPLTGAVFHLLMVFSYPILVASAVATTGDEEPLGALRPGQLGKRPGWAYWLLMLAALMIGSVFGARLAGGVGVVFWLGLWLVFLILTQTMDLGYGAGIFGFTIGYTAILLGGLTIVARRWGEAAVGPWIAFSIVMLILLLRRLAPLSAGTRSDRTENTLGEGAGDETPVKDDS